MPMTEPRPTYTADTSPTLIEAQAQLLDILGERRLKMLSEFLQDVTKSGWGGIEIVICDNTVQLIKVKSIK
jgi:hypothetical protein